MNRLTPAEVQSEKIHALGFASATLTFSSIEVIASALRRAAGFLCPCSASTLIRSVVAPLRGLVADLDAQRALVGTTLDAMVAHGDLLEQRELSQDPSAHPSVLLYAAPPGMVVRQSGTVILVGIPPAQATLLPTELQSRVEYSRHVRRLVPKRDEDLPRELSRFGLLNLSKVWMKAPDPESPAEHLERMDRLLNAAHPSRDVPGLTLLDSQRPVYFYPDRWVQVRSQTGRFVGRRSQAYGADLWCYVQVHEGYPERLVDLPLVGSRWRGCDDAWRLQLAIDVHRNQPQRYRASFDGELTGLLEIFSPLPGWARRRWDAVGEEVLKAGCLFAYRFARSEIGEELRFAQDALWMGELK
jgi:hypothetical protein